MTDQTYNVMAAECHSNDWSGWRRISASRCRCYVNGEWSRKRRWVCGPAYDEYIRQAALGEVIYNDDMGPRNETAAVGVECLGITARHWARLAGGQLRNMMISSWPKRIVYGETEGEMTARRAYRENRVRFTLTWPIPRRFAILDQMPFRLLVLLCAAAPTLWAVTPLSVGSLLQHPAHYFDLQQRRVLFTPRASDAYDVTTVGLTDKLDGGKPLGNPNDPKGYSWHTRLPFSFPFAGRNWKDVYINLNGTLTFSAPEDKEYPERDTWADGTMRWLASSFDTGAVDGDKPMIVPLWGLYSAEKTRIYTQSSADWFAVTWHAIRYQGVNEGYTPLGENVFQVRLARSGSIEFRYGDVAEKDGIVGVFCGATAGGKLLDSVDLPPSRLDPALNLRHVELQDDGADLHFTMTLAGDIPAKSVRPLRYQVVAMGLREGYGMDLVVDPSRAATNVYCFVLNAQDHPVGTDCTGKGLVHPGARTVQFYLPKIDLKDPAHLAWKAGTATGDFSSPAVQTSEGLRNVDLTPLVSGVNLAGGQRSAQGSIYEIFYYPFVSRSRHNVFQEISKRVSVEDDLAVAVTDFRIDDIHNHGADSATDHGNSRELFGSPRLQSVAGPIYLGPRFREVIEAGGYRFYNYAFAVGWMGHEMTHRWVAVLNWKPPDTLALRNPKEPYHWSPFLNAPAAYPVWKLFSDKPYAEASTMGGMAVEKLPDGSMRSVMAPPGAPSGLSALDLYSMGLIGPEEVPDTFFIANAQPAEGAGHKGGDMVAVKIADIVEANGPQNPPAAEAQHDFRFQIYLLHEDGREPDPQKLAQARAIETMVLKYFDTATGGRMKVAASAP